MGAFCMSKEAILPHQFVQTIFYTNLLAGRSIHKEYVKMVFNLKEFFERFGFVVKTIVIDEDSNEQKIFLLIIFLTKSITIFLKYSRRNKTMKILIKCTVLK